jgi:hypothetical protein
MFIARYKATVNDDRHPGIPGGWEGGPIERAGFLDGYHYYRYPNQAALDGVDRNSCEDFRQATAEEIESLGALPQYPREESPELLRPDLRPE